MTLVKLLEGQERDDNRKVLDLVFQKLYGGKANEKAKAFNEVMVPQFKALLANRETNLRVLLNRSFDQLMNPEKVAQQNEPVTFKDVQMLAAIIDEGIPEIVDVIPSSGLNNMNELTFALKAIYLDAYIDTLANQSEEIFNAIAQAKMSKIIQLNQGGNPAGGHIIMP